MGSVEPKCAPVKLNVRQRRRKAMHELHTMKLITARLVGVDESSLSILSSTKSRNNIHMLQVLINRQAEKQ